MAAGIVTVQINKRQLAEVQAKLAGVKGGMAKVLSGAINRTLSPTRTEIVRQITEHVTFKKSVVKKNLRLQKATRSRLIGRIDSVNDRRLELSYFSPRQTKKGVTYKIEKAGPRKLIPSAFITIFASGHRAVRKRTTARRSSARTLYGTSIGNVFAKAEGISARVKKSAYKKLGKNIDNQVAWLLSKRRAR